MTTRHLFATLRMAACAVLGLASLAASQATTPLADQPIFTNTSVPGNLALVLSVEFPTAISVAHQGAFIAGTKYLGYFDPAKCYRYVVGTESGTNLSHFTPVSTATAAYKCTAGGFTDTWSGSFMNWLTMQAIDPFRWALTGGLRVVDTTNTTILERAWATSDGNNGGDDNFPPIPTSDGNPLKARPSPSSADIADHTPLSLASLKVSVRTRGNKVRFSDSGDLNSGTPTGYTQATSVASGTVYDFYVRVKVCEAGTGFTREENCKAYPSGYYKPEGLIHGYAEKMRYSAFGYLNDPTDNIRDGGAMRARQKFVGPQVIRPGSTPAANTAREWDPETGVFYVNPDTADATATTAALGVSVTNSGVINYLNKFGQEQKTYKRRDPVSELYYGALRYLKNQGHVPAWTNISGDSNKVRLVDGFPVITSWDDPLQYSCQKNYIIGIGDTNTNWDRNLPGSSGGSSEPSMPPEVSGDTTVNSVTATNKVGAIDGLGGSLGTAGISNGSYLMAGLAYDAHTKDIRPDDPTKPQTSGKQTVATYWLDVLEFGNYVSNNQYYLATKYGGFKVPNTFDPYTRTAALPQEWWRTNSDTVGGQPRPDNYFTASRPDQMVDGLRKIFNQVSNDLDAFTTSFSTALPQVAQDGDASYSAKYDAGNWTGELTASKSIFDVSTGEPSLTEKWTFSAKLEAQLNGTGWDTNRRVVTWNPATAAGAAFRTSGGISAAQATALDTVYGTGVDSTTYLNYLRGDRTYEEGQPAATAAVTYRKRDVRVGDIVGSKVKVVGAPTAPFSSATNPGYGAFKTTWATRMRMLYVGSNDGMLHAVDASLDAGPGLSPGKEVFAFVPNALYQGPSGTPAVNGLQSIGDPDFAHHNFVDASPAAFDIDFGRTPGGTGTTDWRTVLVGPLGKGGKSYFAIDVTNPAGMTSESLAASKVLWEFTHADLGFTYGEPASVKTKKYGWVLIFGSGYNNSDGQGYFFIVNPRTGALLEKIGTGVGSSGTQAGLAHVQAFVLDRTEGVADSVYAGDLLGNLWRLDVSSAVAAYPAPVKLAELSDGNGNLLPVTSRPLVVIQPGTNRRFVTVGTGRFLDNGDISSTQPQAYFAIIDGSGVVFNKPADLPAGFSFPIVNSKLKKLTDLTQTVTLDFANHIGWWVDLGAVSGGPGWRVISDSTSYLGIVAFSAMVPSASVCAPSGTSRIFAIDLGTGQSRLQVGETFIPYNDAVPGVVTDLRFYSVSGVPRLIGGSDTGAVKALKGKWGGTLGLRRLNWRELQLAD